MVRNRVLRGRAVRGILTASMGLLVFVGTGAASPAPRRPASPNRQRAWMDAKNMCVFSLGEGRMPQDPNELSVALKDGWKQVISVPDPQRAVVIGGGDAYPSLDTLKIDLSDAQLHPPAKKEKVELNNRVEKNLDVQHLEVRGEPVLLKNAKLNMRLTADGARIDMERDRRGRPVMLLAQARAGTLSFDVSRSDAEQIMLQNAREMASPYGVNVEKMQLLIVPETPRSVQAELYVGTKVALIPAGMLFKAHVTVDDNMNARISGLSCEGDEALGPLIVHFLRPALQKYEGRTRPLVSFPERGMRLNDVAVRVDDRLHLTAAFGS